MTADYLHIHHTSIWHGLDRVFATGMTVFVILRAVYGISPTAGLWALIPIGSPLGTRQPTSQPSNQPNQINQPINQSITNCRLALLKNTKTHTKMAFYTRPWSMSVRCYLGGSNAKTKEDLAAWHYWHFLWHLTGARACARGVA